MIKRVRLTIFTFLVVIHNSVFAQTWVTIGSTADMAAKIDITSINSLENGFKKSWALMDFKEKAGNTDAKSIVALAYFNCASNTYSFTGQIAYNENNGNGKIIMREEQIPLHNLKFDSPPPGTIFDSMLKFVCQPRDHKSRAPRATGAPQRRAP